MDQPGGFVGAGMEDHVRELQRCLHEVKQGGSMFASGFARRIANTYILSCKKFSAGDRVEEFWCAGARRDTARARA